VGGVGFLLLARPIAPYFPCLSADFFPLVTCNVPFIPPHEPKGRPPKCPPTREFRHRSNEFLSFRAPGAGYNAVCGFGSSPSSGSSCLCCRKKKTVKKRMSISSLPCQRAIHFMITHARDLELARLIKSVLTLIGP